jgi:nucleotide-binding universal stress UspA family protein
VLHTDAVSHPDVDSVYMAARPRRIMVGYDGSDASRRALDAAADLVGYGSTLSVVTVKNGDVGSWVTGDAHARLLIRHVEARYHEATGEPAEQLIEKATELHADLVVVGRRNRNPLRALLGSVSSRVVRRAPCDVLVVR